MVVYHEKMRIDSNGVIQLPQSGNNGYINYNSTDLELDVNRNPETGVFADTNKSHARISISGANGGSTISFKTAAANNTTATEKMRITSGGDLSIKEAGNFYSGNLRNDSVTVPANTSTTVLDFTGAGAGIYMITVCRSGGSTGEHAVYIVQWTGSSGGVSTTLHAAGWSSPTFVGTSFRVSNGNTRTCHATAQPLSLN